MPTFSRGDVVRVPFPYTDGQTSQRRPALVVSDGAIGDNGLLLWSAGCGQGAGVALLPHAVTAWLR